MYGKLVGRCFTMWPVSHFLLLFCSLVACGCLLSSVSLPLLRSLCSSFPPFLLPLSSSLLAFLHLCFTASLCFSCAFCLFVQTTQTLSVHLIDAWVGIHCHLVS
ncbi:hypothetical protein BD289DRAFT_429427 [Coniella lustricola]|uniref:Uncharacterized protein n=1 Tax=Coniella lustricola TaxID=2025994 RepID=A0A2T3ACZ6_9PEZI|nr:hypothetical protein BD289DRAFT_429427 [Coniella lustricola]